MRHTSTRQVPHWTYAVELLSPFDKSTRVTLRVLDVDNEDIDLFDVTIPHEKFMDLATQHPNLYSANTTLPMSRREILEHIHHNVLHQLAILSLEGK